MNVWPYAHRGPRIRWALLCLLLISRAYAQEQATEQEIIHGGVNLVLMDVGVLNGAGKPVLGLPKDRFEVRENGVSRELAYFKPDTDAISITLAVDASASMLPRWQALLRGVADLVQLLRPEDRSALTVFNEAVEVLVPPGPPGIPTHWVELLAKRRPTGQTSLYDALIRSVHLLDESPNDRRVVIIISDGKDTSSRASLNEVVNTLQSSNRIVYTVGLFSPQSQDTNMGTLRKLAQSTGGLAFFPPDSKDLSLVLRQILEDLRSRYLIGYYASDAKAGNTEVRKLSVTVRDTENHRLRVRARTEYRIMSHTDAIR